VADLELLTTSQVLALLQIGRTKLWELVRGEAFPAYRIGEGRNSSLRYRRSDVLGWLERNRVNGASRLELGLEPEPESSSSRAR
jgi:predicted DNA-binding transcriptional regulator AlpA